MAYHTGPFVSHRFADMQFLFEFLPIVLFFAAYKFGGLFVATGVLIAAVVVQATIQWIRHRKLSAMMIASAVLVLIFGGLTLALHDAAFIKWKPTLLYWLFAIAFVASRFFGEKPLIERVMGENLTLERSLWRRLNWIWAVFFVFLGVLNLYVARQYEEATWVNFKLFGLMGLTLAFALAQGIWLATKMPAEESPPKSDDSKPQASIERRPP